MVVVVVVVAVVAEVMLVEAVVEIVAAVAAELLTGVEVTTSLLFSWFLPTLSYERSLRYTRYVIY